MNGNGHAQIISLLGGGKKLTARLKSLTEENVNEKTVYSWVQQGIPDRWKVAVARCLLEDNIEITKYKELGYEQKSICYLNTKLAHEEKRKELLLK